MIVYSRIAIREEPAGGNFGKTTVMKQILCIIALHAALAVQGQAKFALITDKPPGYLHLQAENPELVSVVVYMPKNIGLWKQHETALIRQSDSALHHLSDEHMFATYVDIDPVDSIAIGVEYIGPKLAPLFEYRLVVNGIASMPWSPFTRFGFPRDIKPYMSVFPDESTSYIGKYRGALGTSLTIEVRRKGRDTLSSSVVVLWEKAAPVVASVFRQQDLKDFVSVLRDQGKRDVLSYTHEGPGRWIDSLLDKRTAFASTENNLVFYLGERIHDKSDIEYSLTGPDSTSEWRPNDFDNNFLWLKNLSPGHYVLHLRYRVQPGNVTEYTFEIRPAWYQTATFKIIAGSLITAFFALIIVLFRLRAKQRRVIQLELKNARSEARLASVKSQLNPHFIFNALSSIQGLVNKRDLGAANQYLGDFGELLRKSLESSDMISMDREMETLDTYLRLEQLRFHFQYTLFVDPMVPKTEIPALILQPIVENAVKHGVSALQEKGEIDILVTKEDDGLIVYIRNNGPGFDPTTPQKGLGVKLTMERITLLRESGRDVVLRIDSEPGKQGTIAYVYFNHWL